MAEAEARVHGMAVSEVHFHEVGATDAIVDIVGAAICYHRLGVGAVWSSPVELGGGFVRCAHGLIPVPAPATVEILQGIPTTRGAVRQETATPTGAAILAVLVDTFTDAPALVTEKTAYGIGHRDTALPNVLRVHLARPVSPVGSVRPARLLQCNIDDMPRPLLAGEADGAGTPEDALNASPSVQFFFRRPMRPAVGKGLRPWPSPSRGGAIARRGGFGIEAGEGREMRMDFLDKGWMQNVAGRMPPAAKGPGPLETRSCGAGEAQDGDRGSVSTTMWSLV